MLFEIDVPYADLRGKPSPRDTNTIEQDDDQQTQLLKGEQVFVEKTQSKMSFVRAIQQPYWLEGWVPYPGWVQTDQLRPVSASSRKVVCPDFWSVCKAPMGSYVDLCNSSAYRLPLRPSWRQELIELGMQWLGVPYLWGGLTPDGIDCSGLVHLLYRTAGLIMPRNAGDQIRVCSAITKEQLDVGDLLFTGKSAEKPDHVLIYTGQDRWLEASGSAKAVVCRPLNPAVLPFMRYATAALIANRV